MASTKTKKKSTQTKTRSKTKTKAKAKAKPKKVAKPNKASLVGTIREIMNPKLLYILEGQRLTLVRGQILKFGVTGVPVLDGDHRPVGFVSLRDLALAGADDDAVRVNAPVFTLRDTDSIRDGATRLARTDYHHAVVVDGEGVAVGMVAAVDFLRALTDLEARHPARFADVR